MRGSIVERETKDGRKSYSAVFRVDGRQRWKTFTKRRAAEKFLTTSVKAAHDGTWADVNPELMAVVFDRWLTHSLAVREKTGELKPSTGKSYRSMLATHLRPEFGAIRSDRLRPPAVNDWKRKLADGIADGSMTPKTANNLINLLHAIIGWAKDPAQAYLAHDPLVGLKRLPRVTIERCFLEPEQIDVLLQATGDARDGVIIAVAAYSGLRRGELFALRWSDIDWCAARINVRRSVYQGAIGTPKTPGSTRWVDVPDYLLKTLALYRVMCPPVGEGYVFRTDDGAILDPDNWSKRRFAFILKAAPTVKATGLHTLRHTYASILINANEPLKYVTAQLGHAKIAITQDLYGHLFKSTGTAAMRRLDANIGGAVGTGKVVAINRVAS